MKVKELIAKLEKVDPELEITFDFLSKGFRIVCNADVEYSKVERAIIKIGPATR